MAAPHQKAAEPKSAELIAPGAASALEWEVIRDLLADARLYWLATVGGSASAVPPRRSHHGSHRPLGHPGPQNSRGSMTLNPVIEQVRRGAPRNVSTGR